MPIKEIKPPSERRNVYVSFLVTEDEARQLKEACKNSGLARSQYIRYKIFGGVL